MKQAKKKCGGKYTQLCFNAKFNRGEKQPQQRQRQQQQLKPFLSFASVLEIANFSAVWLDVVEYNQLDKNPVDAV